MRGEFGRVEFIVMFIVIILSSAFISTLFMIIHTYGDDGSNHAGHWECQEWEEISRFDSCGNELNHCPGAWSSRDLDNNSIIEYNEWFCKSCLKEVWTK